MPETLHAELASEADRAGTSLNQFITTTLAESIGQDGARGREHAPKAEAPDSADTRGRWFTALLVVNLLVVAAAGVLAILLLVSAWRG